MPSVDGRTGAQEAVDGLEVTSSTAAREVRRLIYGHIVSKAVQAFVTLALPEAMRDTESTVDELAVSVKVQPAALRRLLRALATFDIVRETIPDTFVLGPLGRELCADAAESARPTALLAANVVGDAWAGIEDTVRTGKPAFERIAGTGFFACLAGDPHLRSVFDASQAAGLHAELDEILAALAGTPVGTVVDLGGGDGALLERVLVHRPESRGVLVDRAEAREAATTRMTSAGLRDRFEFRTADFFADELPEGDLYVLRHILHDHGDDDVATILRSCRRAMPPSGTVAIIDAVAPEDWSGGGRQQSQDAAVMDLYMLSLFTGGKERTYPELVALLSSCAFDTVGHHPLPGGAALTLARPR